MVSTAVLSELMVTEVVTATPEDLLSHIIERMRERRISSIVICDDRKPVGIITERDLLTAVKTHRSLSSLKAKDLMRSPVFTLPASQDCRTAYMKMEQLGYRHLVVVDQQGNLAGIVDEGDFLKNLTADQLLAVKEIRQVMSTEVVTVPLGTALDDAFSIMADRSLSCVVIEDRGTPVGIITERDVVRLVQEYEEIVGLNVEQVMSSPLLTLPVTANVLDARTALQEASVRRVIVVDDDGAMVGLATRHDLVKGIPSAYVEALREVIDQQRQHLSDVMVDLEGKALLDNVFNVLPYTGAVVLDTELRISYINSVARTICNLSDNSLGMSVSSDPEVPGFSFFSKKGWHAELLEFGQLHESLVLLREGDPKPVQIEASLSGLKDADGQQNGYLLTLRDVSLRVERERRYSETQWRQDVLFHRSNDAILIHESCAIVDANEKVESLLGRSCGDLIGSPVGDYIENGCGEFCKDIESTLDRDGTARLEGKILRNSGQSVPVEFSSSRIFVDGKPFVQTVIRDLTEFKKSEEELQKARDFYLSLLDKMPDMVWRATAEGERDYFNKAWQNFTGYQLTDSLSGKWLEFIHPDDRSAYDFVFTRALENRESFQVDYRLLRRDGSYRWIQDSGAPYSNEAGDFSGYIGSCLDVDDRLKLTLNLQHSEARFRALFEQASVGMARVGTEGEWLQVNQALSDITGYSKQELLKLTWQQITHPEDLQEDVSFVERMLSGEIPSYSMEKRYIRKDGREIWVKITVAALIWDEDIRGDSDSKYFVSVIEDIDQQKRSEAALQKSEAKYRELFEGNQAIALLIDPDSGALIDCNRAAMKFYSYSREKLCSMSIWDISLSSKSKLQAYLRIQAQKGASQFFSRHRIATGEVKDVEVNAGLVVLDGRQLIYVIVHDISERRKIEQRLAQADTEWSYAMEFFDDAIYLIDTEQTIVKANRAFCELVKKPSTEVLGRKVYKVMHQEVHPENCPVCRAHQMNRDQNIVLEIDDPNNPYDFPAEINSRVIKSKEGDVSGKLVSIRNLSNQRRTEERLRQSATVFENTREGVLITDANVKIVAVNRAFTEITGFTEEEVLGGNPRLLKSGLQDKDFYKEMWEKLNSTYLWEGEIWNRNKAGEIYPQWLSISVVRDDQGRIINYVGVVTDITQLKHSQEQLEYLAHHDPLTGLPNRLLMTARVEHAIDQAERSGESLAFMFLDLDRFKHVNDSFGHGLGDALLQEVAVRLKGLIRREDTVARLGGDEFTILLEGLSDAEDAAILAAKVVDSMSEPFRVEEHELYLGGSVGISIYPRDGKSVDQLLQNADAAMYRAKDEGRNTFRFYSEDLTVQAFERVVVEGQLRRAIEQDELRLHYQPQVDLQSGELVGMEALVRWQHPDQGVVPPSRFIPIAEDTGLIIQLGEWVLVEACRQARRWLDEGLVDAKVSVNVSRPQFIHGDFVRLVKETLEKTGLPAKYLELEVTESFIMGQEEESVGILTALRDLGITLAIDDFGTGYSSLAYLKTLPFDLIKIDQGFVRDIPQDENDAAIARAVIALGNSLQYAVIAEGIENRIQRNFLTEHGCRLGQGFWIARPMPADEFLNWYDRWKLKPFSD